MPRPSLPASLKALRTFSVVLTKTTQEELWLHFVDAFSWYSKRAYYLINKIEEIDTEIVCANPFSKCSWRNTSLISAYPTRKYADESPHSVFDEAECSRYEYLIHIHNDLDRCGRILGWKDDEEYAPTFAEFIAQAEYIRYELSLKLKMLASTEDTAYNNAKRNWKLAHKDEIDDNQLRERHNKHKTKKEWIEIFKEDSTAARWYNSIPPNDEDTCKYCIGDKERRDKENKAAIDKYRQEQKDAEADAKRRAEEEYTELEIERERKEMENKQQTCEMCDYTATSISKFDIHLASREHIFQQKLKSRHCNICDIQCKNADDYTVHLSTQKHKKKAGEIVEPEEYRCDPCDYTTGLKHHYTQHCATKRHHQKKGEQPT